MRKLWGLVLSALLLSACGRAETMETVADVWDVPAAAIPRQMYAELPEDGSAEALEGDTGRMYMTDDDCLSLETLAAGDLNATLTQLCGRGKDGLTVLETRQDGAKRYDFVWAAAGEAGEVLGRGTILDDGDYHYCMTALYPAGEAKDPKWDTIFHSFRLE